MRTIATPFRISAAGGVATTSDIDVIATQEIRDVLVTDLRERVMRPNHTAMVASLLFDTTDPNVLADAATEARQRCNELITVCNVVQIDIVPDDRMNNAGTGADSVVRVNAYYTIPPLLGIRTASFTISGLITEETR